MLWLDRDATSIAAVGCALSISCPELLGANYVGVWRRKTERDLAHEEGGKGRREGEKTPQAFSVVDLFWSWLPPALLNMGEDSWSLLSEVTPAVVPPATNLWYLIYLSGKSDTTDNQLKKKKANQKPSQNKPKQIASLKDYFFVFMRCIK